jgi:hypothetical protein
VSRRFLPWRRVTPADLPPVSASAVPGPMHSGLVSDIPKPTAPAAAPLAAEPAPLDAPRYRPPVPAIAPGRYRVTYDRVGRHGSARSGLPAPVPLTCVALDAADLAEQVLHDCRGYLGHSGVRVVVDAKTLGGLIRRGDQPAGTFRFERLGGAR